MEYTPSTNENPKDQNMYLAGLGDTRILTDYAQKFLRTLIDTWLSYSLKTYRVQRSLLVYVRLFIFDSCNALYIMGS